MLFASCDRTMRRRPPTYHALRGCQYRKLILVVNHPLVVVLLFPKLCSPIATRLLKQLRESLSLPALPLASANPGNLLSRIIK